MNAVDVEIDTYLDGVRQSLADLPAEVRDDLLEDLPGHFAELLEEQNGTLRERLGPPAAYAAELRAAAGLDAGWGPGGQGRVWIDPELVERVGHLLRTADARVGRLIGYARATEFVRKLQPAWWVLRAYLVSAVLLDAGGTGSSPLGSPVGWVLTIVLVLLSVRIGAIPLSRIPQAGRIALAGVVALLALLVLIDQSDRFGQPFEPSAGPYDRWSQVTDVYPYYRYGNPLTDVKLYDQNGAPMHFGDYLRCATEDQSSGNVAYTPSYPLCKVPPRQLGGAASPSQGPSPSPVPSQSPATALSASPGK